MSLATAGAGDIRWSAVGEAKHSNPVNLTRSLIPHAHPSGFQVQMPDWASAVEDDAQQLDGLRRFFLRRESIGDRPYPADLLIDLQQFLTEQPEPMKGFHFALRLTHFLRGSKVSLTDCPLILRVRRKFGL